jgi:hypothetical protein
LQPRGSLLFSFILPQRSSFFGTLLTGCISLIRKKSDTTKKLPFFRRKIIELFIFLIRVFKIEESESADTVGKKGILYT